MLVSEWLILLLQHFTVCHLSAALRCGYTMTKLRKEVTSWTPLSKMCVDAFLLFTGNMRTANTVCAPNLLTSRTFLYSAISLQKQMLLMPVFSLCTDSKCSKKHLHIFPICFAVENSFGSFLLLCSRTITCTFTKKRKKLYFLSHSLGLCSIRIFHWYAICSANKELNCIRAPAVFSTHTLDLLTVARVEFPGLQWMTKKFNLVVLYANPIQIFCVYFATNQSSQLSRTWGNVSPTFFSSDLSSAFSLLHSLSF